MVNQTTLAQLTSQVQSFATNMHAMFNNIQSWALIITNLGTAGLQAAPYSMTSGDATDLFNAAQDFEKFRKVYFGLMYVTAGATANTGVPTLNDGTHFGYPFNLNPDKCGGLGY